MAKKSELAAERAVVGPLGVTSPPEIHIECEAFQGSLGALFLCVHDHKIDLLDVPMAPICEAYFHYVLATTDTDLEQAAVALAALAYLLERKAWALIPTEQEEPEDDALSIAAEPYAHLFEPAVRNLLERREERDLLFFRWSENVRHPYELPFDTSDVQIGDLAGVLERLLARAVPDTMEPLGKPRRSLAEQMLVVLRALPLEFSSLDSIVVGEFTRSEVVWWFLALLELIRLGQARVRVSEYDVLFARGAES
ncbi:MAG: segregation/condensation protein A [Armatimonadetes bacterium]|nr:segregation/condensation protein A [Armatimonadota bacterium]